MGSNPAGRLADRVALISGASRGIGRAIALAYAREGANIGLLATNVRRLDDVAEECRSLGAQTLVSRVDVAERDECAAAVDAARERFGPVDVLVTSASVYLAAGFLDHKPEDFQRILDVDLMGAVHLMQAVLPEMVERGYGRIVNISSTAGKSGSVNKSAYSAAKHAVVGLTRSVALEFARFGITANTVCPGPVQTDMLDELIAGKARLDGVEDVEAVRAAMQRGMPAGRFLEPGDVANFAVYLGSAESEGMNGQSIWLDGGLHG